MHILLWVVQVALALQAFAGGAYKIVQFEEIAKMPAVASLPRAAWTFLGVFEMACGILLVVPAATGFMPELTVLGAAALAVESLGLAALYGRYSLAWTATNPLVYVVVGALVATFVAYGRYAIVPLH
jgi:hypothetical protein